jgi:hypothetical protein
LKGQHSDNRLMPTLIINRPIYAMAINDQHREPIWKS